MLALCRLCDCQGVLQPQGTCLPFPQACTRPYHSPQLLHSKVKAVSWWPATDPGAHTYSSSSPISRPVRPCRMVCGNAGGSPHGFSEKKEPWSAFPNSAGLFSLCEHTLGKSLPPTLHSLPQGSPYTLNWDHAGSFSFTPTECPAQGSHSKSTSQMSKHVINATTLYLKISGQHELLM